MQRFALGWMACWTLSALASAAPPKVEELLTGLNNPCGVAVQPETGDVFVSDSGVGRVIRVSPKKPGKPTDVITGFAQDIYGKGPKYSIGPLGLAFMDKNTLVVGGGDLPDAQEVVRVFQLPASGKPLKPEDATHVAGPIGPGDASLKGEGNFYGIAITPTAIYVTSNGDDTKGWIASIDLTQGEADELVPYIATKALTQVDAPVGIAQSGADEDGGALLVVTQMGEVNVAGDSLLTLYQAETGKLLAKGPTGLSDLAGVAYSPKTSKLYTVDFAWADTKQGGLFMLDPSGSSGDVTVKTEKIVSLDKPSALAFAPDGTLYITVFGSDKEGTTKNSGKLLRIAPGL